LANAGNSKKKTEEPCRNTIPTQWTMISVELVSASDANVIIEENAD